MLNKVYQTSLGHTVKDSIDPMKLPSSYLPSLDITDSSTESSLATIP